MIRPVLMLFCVVSTILVCLDLPAQDVRTYHYQFIRGSSRKAAAAAARPIEPHLKSRLAALFRWRDFAQLAEDDCALHEEETAAIELPEGGQLHLRRSAEKLDVRLYRDGRRCAGTPRTGRIVGLFIIAGDPSGSDCWFIALQEVNRKKTTTAGAQGK